MKVALDKHWHLAEDDHEIDLTELEFSVIEKSGKSDSKKGVTYVATALGCQITDKFAAFRRELLIALTESMSTDIDMADVAKVLNLLSGIYDQASCIAAAHRVTG